MNRFRFQKDVPEGEPYVYVGSESINLGRFGPVKRGTIIGKLTNRELVTIEGDDRFIRLSDFTPEKSYVEPRPLESPSNRMLRSKQAK